ncbi:MAG: hypothetical protein F4Z01_08195 [Gammaproteobacteria bacterium]|nr:hypothetical protein [Gammaproteobacteria bacterium]MYF37168.1 hypothetical protein [Gammaproteobacteria bacterium]
MKCLLVVALVLPSFCVIADERIILGSFERETAESEGAESNESTSRGFGARYYDFSDEGLYLGASFAILSEDSEECFQSRCYSSDTTVTMFSAELGRDIGSWTPFIGLNFVNAAIDGDIVSTSVGSWGVDVGSWVELDNFKLRGVINNIEDNVDRTVIGGILFQMNNNFVLGAEVGMLLGSEVDGSRFSLQFGMKF